MTRDDAARVPRRPGSSRTTPRWSSSATSRWTRSCRKLESAVRGLEAGEVAGEEHRRGRAPARSIVYLIDRPGPEQSIIFAGHVAPPKGESRRDRHRDDERRPRRQLHRADQHEPARGQALVLRRPSVLVDARGQRPFIVYAPVQTDKTKESMVEIHKELSGIRRWRAAAHGGRAGQQGREDAHAAGTLGDERAVINDIVEMVRFGLAQDYW